MKTWTRHEETPGLPEGYRREDGWHLHYDGRSIPQGWVISHDAGLLPPLEARNHELGVDEADKAQEWADVLDDLESCFRADREGHAIPSLVLVAEPVIKVA